MNESNSFGDHYRRLSIKTFWLFLLGQSLASLTLFFVWAFLLFSDQFIERNYLSFFYVGREIVFWVFLLITGLTILIAWLRYITFNFMMGEHGLKILRGIFNKHEVTIPYRQIQNINIRRSIWDRFFRASHLIVLTAGVEARQAESEGAFPVLDKFLAEEIQHELLKRAHTEEEG